MTATNATSAGDRPEPEPLLVPRDGVPPVVETPGALRRAADALAGGHGPVAADAERASGFRYGQHNYLVQFRREGAGTFLIDTAALPDLTAVDQALRSVEWVFHAASQDLLPMSEQHLHPDVIFDTELAARLLGMPRVGLGTVVAEVLGRVLRKEHSAADWSRRPLPTDWLTYAALDVEVLVDLRDALEEQLRSHGKLDWARQEFEHERLAPAPPPRAEPWRRLSHLTEVRGQRRLAVARSLWLARDASARVRDLSPGRVLPDRAIIAAAKACPRSVPDLLTIPEFAGKHQRRRAAHWLAAVTEALNLPEEDLPLTRGPHGDGPPQARSWPQRAPEAAARLRVARQAVATIADSVAVPVENILQPDALRRLCWDPEAWRSSPSITALLTSRGARPWQVELVVEPLHFAFAHYDGSDAHDT